MRELLTIGEVAKLLNLSTSQIRFYEKKGLLEPKMIDENGYRLYSFREIDALEVITTFRRLDMPINQIKEMVERDDDYDYLGVMDRTAESLKAEIKRLSNTLDNVEHMRDRYVEIISDEDMVADIPERKLYIVDEDATVHKTAKEVYDFVQWLDLPYTDHRYLFYNIVNEDQRFLGVHYSYPYETLERLPAYILEAGTYFSIQVKIETYEEAKVQFKELYRRCEAAGYVPVGEYIAIEDLSTLSFSKTKTHLTLQTRVEPR